MRTAPTCGSTPSSLAEHDCYDDAFVDRELSLATAALLPRVHVWIINEYEHSGLRTSGERVLDRLIGIAREL